MNCPHENFEARDRNKPPSVKARPRLRARSAKEAKRMAEYNKRRKEWLKGKWCAVFTCYRAECVHHLRGRTGALLMDERFWLPVSLEGHRWIDANREKARAQGWLCKAGDWQRQP